MSRVTDVLSAHKDKILYVIVGIWNTVFGYASFALLYNILNVATNYVVIISLSYVLSITNAFVGYRYFVFKSKGGFFREYLRFYLVYGVAYIFNLVSFPVLVQYLNINAYLSQIIINIIVVMSSYVLHKNYSFKVK